MTMRAERPDAAIERVLKALGGMEMPTGMEQRLLSTLAQRTAMRASGQRSGPRWAETLQSGWREALRERGGVLRATATAAVVVLLMVMSLSLRHRPRGVAVDRRTAEAGRPAASLHGETAREAVRQAGRGEGMVAPMEHSARAARVRAARVRRRDDGAEPGEKAASVTEYATFAPSLPAPPMPLTEQERLMLRIVHRGDPVEIAELNPAARAARTAEEQAEFQRFFAPPIRGDHE